MRCALVAAGKPARLAHDRGSGAAAQSAAGADTRAGAGACFGGGTGIVAACDIVIAADNAKFSIAEVRIGVAGTIIIPQLNDAIGLRQVRRYALTGERFDAQEAHRIGLVHEIVPLDELEAAGERIVDELLTNGPDAVRRPRSGRSNRPGAISTIRPSPP